MTLTIPTRSPDHLDIPQPLLPLRDLAYDFWWSWSRPARRLFERIDPDRWARYRNPVRQLLYSRASHLHDLAEQESFVLDMAEVVEAWQADRNRPGLPGAPVAYVSAEYGLHESLPVYSGGLGVLSGDHLKEASDLGVPMVGIGLFYRRGYFRQLIDPDGSQQHLYPDLDALRLPLLRVSDSVGGTLRVPVDLPGRRVWLRVWLTNVGRVPLLLLDSMTTHNETADRYLTSQLYVTGRQMRLEQEVILGRGAVALLEALGIEPSVWHMNEGHSAFLALENLARRASGDLRERVESVRPHHVFTTHTPVPAGNEVFDVDAVRPFLDQTAEAAGTDTESLLAMGEGEKPGFNLTALALNLSCRSNGVSLLHGDVSREMWPGHEIGAITNGVHAGSWLGQEMARVLAASSDSDPAELARRAESLPDETLWAAHTAQKHRLMRFVRVRMTRQAARHGQSTDELRRVQDLLDPNALTLGFARRFAPYKRADLLFHDPERLAAILCDPDRPVQVLMAGKAHPADKAGQDIIRRVWELANGERLAGRIVFVEDYDIAVARLLVRGCDVWLNTPEYPREASGTSGMKAAMNGVLNASVPDGWWAEVVDAGIGFTLGAAELPDADRDGPALLELLENQVVAAWHERDQGGLPRRWIGMMRAAMAHSLRHYSARRMLEEYREKAYAPALPVAAG
jgi:starch phosphorylase